MTRFIKLVVIAAIAVTTLLALPHTAMAADSNSPSLSSGTIEPPAEPPLPVTPPDPPHVAVSYTVSAYVDKEIDALPSGEITAREVRRVEDLSFVANKLKLTTDEIKYSNPDKDVTQLKEGDVISVPPVHGIVYKVKQGDVLTWIAYSYQVDVQTIVSYNNIQNADQISPDQVVIIPGAKLPPIAIPVPAAPMAQVGYSAPAATYTAAPATGPHPAYSGGNHFYYGYCTYYVANRRPIPWFGDAIQWWPNARSFGYAEGSVPRPGAILVERPNHVAYVESVGSGSFTVSEENWKGWNIVDTRTVQNNDPAIVGFIY